VERGAIQRGLASAVPPRLEWRVGRVIATRRETRQVCTISLAVPLWPGHNAGQHVDLRLTAEDGYQAQRSYSIASAPGMPWLELTVERLSDGEVSPYLTDIVREGDQIEIRGPIGGYFVWTATLDRPLALIAGGSGVVPLMAMLRHRSVADGATGARMSAVLLYSARTADDLIYRDELGSLDASDDTLRIAYTLTRERSADAPGYRRRIDEEMLREVLWPPDALPLVYICGPTPMVESAASMLVNLGYAARDILTERFGPTGGERS
jgi:ferredoxin-NADP reductase